MDLPDVKAIVTGAARGLGREFARQLVAAGASVAAGDINEGGLAELTEEVRSCSGRLHAAKLDVTQENSAAGFVHAAVDALGKLNVLVNNAGILRDGVLAKPENGWTRKMPTSQWRQVLDVNLTGPFLMTREFVSAVYQAETSPAVIVNISSVTRTGNRGQSNYSASKAGLDALTRTWALELAEYGIRVASIAPGVIETPILLNITDEALEELKASIPLARFGTPYEVWLALKFIIECDFFTGRAIEVDGGSIV
ncbi:MAG TPA: SDR family NAD(P)-dependent oxidoreductase [Bryobacteraceae bacterium]|jgi:3-oxoacyl-[acyl-carrier protein] reductase|nr:SDR family NAD(P)-dependent oxidoreductase [Bryobacteraceae bacterium]